MNQLDFSPISEKEEESIDTFSFLQRETNTVYRRQLHHRSHGNMKPIFAHAATKMFLRLERATHNRKSYGFQLLKQFILFSSDEETI